MPERCLEVKPRSLQQNLLYSLALGQLVDQLVEVADALHDRIVNLLDADTADRARLRLRLSWRSSDSSIHPAASNLVCQRVRVLRCLYD